MSQSNQTTLETYEQHAQVYIDGTMHHPALPTQRWIDAALSGLPHSARILEIGSGFGRDAAYVAAAGYAIACSDAADSFVEALIARGFVARKLNLLTDTVDGGQDLILANAVLLHFNPVEFGQVLRKLRAALAEGGRLAISLKAGDGENGQAPNWGRRAISAIGARHPCGWPSNRQDFTTSPLMKPPPIASMPTGSTR